MSKFIDEVQARITGQARMREPLRFDALEAERNLKQVPFSPAVACNIGVVWGRSFTCRSSDVGEATQTVIRELRRAVYGDLYPMMFRLERAVFEGEHDAAMEALREMRREIEGG
jgi:hypothetical protein